MSPRAKDLQHTQIRKMDCVAAKLQSAIFNLIAEAIRAEIAFSNFADILRICVYWQFFHSSIHICVVEKTNTKSE